MQGTRSSRATGRTDDCSGYCWKKIFQTYENRCRKPQRPFRRFLKSYDVDRNSITVRKWIGNNLKSFAIHPNVVGRTVPKGLDPDAVVSGGFGDLTVHKQCLFLVTASREMHLESAVAAISPDPALVKPHNETLIAMPTPGYLWLYM
jgi:hypothetical protein